MAKPTPEQLDAVFLALSHDTRRQVLVLLAQRGGELASGYLAARFSHSWPTTTRHLKVLEDAGLVEVRREGRGSHYRLCREYLTGAVEAWLAHLRPVGPNIMWPATGPRTTAELSNKKGTHHERNDDTQDLPRHGRSEQHRGRRRLLQQAPRNGR